MNNWMYHNCVWINSTRVSRIQWNALCSKFQCLRHKLLLRGFKHAAWFLALSRGRGYNIAHHGYHNFSARFSFPVSPGKWLFPLHLSNSIHVFSVNIQVIPRQIITDFYMYCFVHRLGRSPYRNILTCGTSLVDQWLRICLGSSAGKESACNEGDLGLIPGLGRYPGEGKGYPLQYSCLENPWPEETGGLQSMGLQRVGHSRVTKHIPAQRTWVWSLIGEVESHMPWGSKYHVPELEKPIHCNKEPSCCKEDLSWSKFFKN